MAGGTSCLQNHNYVSIQSRMQHIKWLYNSRQFRQCAKLCAETRTLDGLELHPLQSAFFSFYAAICYDFHARSMHHESPGRVLALERTMLHYDAATKALEKCFVPLPENSMRFGESLVNKETWEQLGFYAHEYGSTKQGVKDPLAPPYAAKAPPLASEKDKTGLVTDDKPEQKDDTRPYRRLSESIINLSLDNDFYGQSSTLSLNRHALLSPAETIERYNEDLSALIRTLEGFMRDVSQIQQGVSAKQSGASVSSASSYSTSGVSTPREDRLSAVCNMSTRSLDKAERIRNGRERRWVRKRFCGERYQELCAMALAEVFDAEERARWNGKVR